MIICSLDYDNTYTRAPDYWLNVIKTAPDNFKFYCITMRWNNIDDSIDPRLKDLIEIVYTGGLRKKKFAADLGIYVDIWIDDCPEAIVEDQK